MAHKRIVVVDDSAIYCQLMDEYIRSSYPDTQVVTYTDPLVALDELDPSFDLLILDLEMPEIDGIEFLRRAVARGFARSKVVVSSANEADVLHDKFRMGECLAVLDKGEPRQQEVLKMILRSVHRH